jgi:hypothetical protein
VASFIFDTAYASNQHGYPPQNKHLLWRYGEHLTDALSSAVGVGGAVALVTPSLPERPDVVGVATDGVDPLAGQDR